MIERTSCESPGCTLKGHVEYDRGPNEPPSTAAATALAQYHEEDVAATNTQLYDHVDPDALDSLFEATHSGLERDPGVVTFTAGDARVTVRADSVRVEPTD